MKLQQSIPPLPEHVPRLQMPSTPTDSDDDTKDQDDDNLKPTSRKPHPLPEASKMVNNNNNNIAMNKDEDDLMDQDEDDLIRPIVNNDLGTAFAGEMFKKATFSRKKDEGSYYYFVNEIFQKINADIVIQCITDLNKNELNTDWTQVSKWIIDFLVSEYDPFTMQYRLMRIIDAKIILALLHSNIQSEYAVLKICVIKLNKCDGPTTGLQ